MKPGVNGSEFRKNSVEVLEQKVVLLERENKALAKRLQSVANVMARQLHQINSSLADIKTS